MSERRNKWMMTLLWVYLLSTISATLINALPIVLPIALTNAVVSVTVVSLLSFVIEPMQHSWHRVPRLLFKGDIVSRLQAMRKTREKEEKHVLSA